MGDVGSTTLEICYDSFVTTSVSRSEIIMVHKPSSLPKSMTVCPKAPPIITTTILRVGPSVRE